MQLLEFLSASDLEAIHDATMNILQDVGIRFPHPEALDLFKKHGYRVEDQLVFLEEKQILNILKDIPSQFIIQARNTENNIVIGDGSPVFATWIWGTIHN